MCSAFRENIWGVVIYGIFLQTLLGLEDSTVLLLRESQKKLLCQDVMFFVRNFQFFPTRCKKLINFYFNFYFNFNFNFYFNIYSEFLVQFLFQFYFIFHSNFYFNSFILILLFYLYQQVSVLLNHQQYLVSP